MSSTLPDGMSGTLHGETTSAFQDMLVLARLRLRLLLRLGATPRAANSGRRTLIRLGVFALIAIFAAFSLANLLTGVLSGPMGQALLAPALVLASTWATLMLFLFSILAMLGALTYRSDLKLLLLTPLSPRLVLAEKYLAVYGTLLLPVLVIGFFILYSVGRALNLGLGYDLGALLVLLLLPAAPLGLAMLIIVGVLRWVPPARARNLAAILGALLSIAAYLGSQIIARNSASRGTGALQQILAQTPHDWWSSLPLSWLGQWLAEIGQGHAGTALPYLVATLALDLVLAGLAIMLSARLFTTGWATYQEVGRRSRRAVAPLPSNMPTREQAEQAGVATLPVAATTLPDAGATLAPRPAQRPAPAWWPLLGKEWRSLRRDPQIWARLLYPLVILGYGFYSTLTQTSTSRLARSGVTGLVFFVSLAFMTFLVLTIFALPIINREGRALYLLALSPLRAGEILGAKWAFCVLPVLIAVEALLAASAVVLHLPLGETLLAAFTFAGLIVALAGGLLLVSLLWPRLDWDNPRRQASLIASLAGSIGGLLLAGATCVLFIVTVLVAGGNPLLAAIPGAAIFALTGAVTIVVAMLAPRRLDALLHGER